MDLNLSEKEFKRFFHALDAAKQMRDGAGAANARYKLRKLQEIFAFDGCFVKAAVFGDAQFYVFHHAVFNFYFTVGVSFDFADLVDGEVDVSVQIN